MEEKRVTWKQPWKEKIQETKSGSDWSEQQQTSSLVESVKEMKSLDLKGGVKDVVLCYWKDWTKDDFLPRPVSVFK